MGQPQSDAQGQQERRDRHLRPIPALAAETAAHDRAGLEDAEAAGGRRPGAHEHQPHLVPSWAQALIRAPRTLDAASRSQAGHAAPAM